MSFLVHQTVHVVIFIYLKFKQVTFSDILFMLNTRELMEKMKKRRQAMEVTVLLHDLMRCTQNNNN